MNAEEEERKKKYRNAIIRRFYSINGETPDKSILETFHFGAAQKRAEEARKRESWHKKRQQNTKNV